MQLRSVEAMIGLAEGTVQLAPYQPLWKDLFNVEAGRLRSALGRHAGQIEHIGSTAIPAMAAKPIIDMMVAVESLGQARRFIPILAALGYAYQEDDPLPDCLLFIKAPCHRETHHLFLTAVTTSFWSEKIRFRDYLRTHPEASEAYKRLKQRLAQRYPQDRTSYTASKTTFIRGILDLVNA